MAKFRIQLHYLQRPTRHKVFSHYVKKGDHPQEFKSKLRLVPYANGKQIIKSVTITGSSLYRLLLESSIQEDGAA